MSGSLSRAVAAAAVFLCGTAAMTWAAGRDDTAEAATTVTRVVLSDDFSGDRGDDPDEGVWVAGGSRAGLDGEGRLVLGSALRTEEAFGQAYGHAEARIKVRRGPGAWRALGVLDASGRIPAGTLEILDSDRVGSDDFHTYAIDWTPTTLTWSLDGRKVLRFTPEKPGEPLALVLNLASGGWRSDYMLVDRVTVSVRVAVAATPSVGQSAPAWKAFTGYKTGQLVRYRDVAYRVREPHTSLPGWQPDLVPALFEKL